MTTADDGNHGIVFEFGDAVKFVDTQAEGRPSVHFSREEFDAFVEGARAGDFDLERLAAAEQDEEDEASE